MRFKPDLEKFDLHVDKVAGLERMKPGGAGEDGAEIDANDIDPVVELAFDDDLLAGSAITSIRRGLAELMGTCPVS